jgi:hypothetical protein
MEALHAGEKVNDVARRYEFSPGQVSKIAATFEAQPAGLTDEPTTIIARIVRRYELQIARFTASAEETIESHPAVTVAAMRGELDALDRYRDVLSAVGQLPENLQVFKSIAEVEQLGKRMLEALKDWSEELMSKAELRQQIGAGLRASRERTVDGVAVELPRLPGGDGESRGGGGGCSGGPGVFTLRRRLRAGVDAGRR